MSLENLTIEKEETKEKSYCTQEGLPVESKIVYFRRDGQPYFLTNDNDGSKSMTRIALMELGEDQGELSYSE